MQFDVLVVGSGPAGAQALTNFMGKRLRVGLIDPGKVEQRYAKLIPDDNFAEIRRSCGHQQRFFLGDREEALEARGERLAAHLTPPRQYLLEGTREHLPFRSRTFSYFQTLARGGLGAGWGGGVCTFSSAEMEQAGIDGAIMPLCYSQVARSIGVSLEPVADTTPLVCDLSEVQPALKIDENAAAILAAYEAKRGALNENGFFLGKAPLAVLTRDLERAGVRRRACSYQNMDYYSDNPGSVYRPAYTLQELEQESGFEHLRGFLALEFAEEKGLVSVVCKSVSGSETVKLNTRKLVLAAGALNSARLVANSYRIFGRKLPLLSNEVRFLPSLNIRRLGSEAGNQKCSLAQLVGVLSRPDGDLLISYFFSYDSLLFFRLVRDMPLPVGLGHLLTRAIVSSLTIATLHFPDRFTRLKWMRVAGPASGEQLPELEAEYGMTYPEKGRVKEDVGRFRRHLRRIGCLPLTVINRGSGTSVHYGGTLPFVVRGEPYVTCEPGGRLNGTRSIYVADSAPWRFLPAKGPTLTIMANARRVAAAVVKDLQR